MYREADACVVFQYKLIFVDMLVALVIFGLKSTCEFEFSELY